jgi:hypothetical protein
MLKAGIMNASDKINRPVIENGFRAFLFLAVSVSFLRRIYDYDIWFHLAIGREVLGNLNIPETEIFVYTLLDTPGAYHAWGFASLLYFFYDQFGFWGVSCVQGVIAGLLALFLYLAASRGEAIEKWAVLFLSALVLLIEFRFVYRPEIILYLFIAVEIYFLEKFSLTGKWKWLAPIPALSMILSWAHPSVLLLLIVLFCYAAGFLWESVRDKTKSRKMVLSISVTILFSILFALANPYGIKQILLPVLLTGEKAFVTKVPELAPVMETAYGNWFVLLVIFGLAPIVTLKGGKRITYGLLLIVFGYLTFSYARNLALLAIAIFVPIVRAFRHLEEKSLFISRFISNRYFSVIAVVILISTLFSVTTRSRWGAGPENALFPVKAAEFMLERKPEGRIFNHFHSGNYLEWALHPEYLVSVDGRHYTFDRSLELYEQVFWMKEGWEKVLMDFDVGTIITPGTNIVKGSLVPLILELDADPLWSLALVEQGAMLFIRTELLRNLDGVQALEKDLIWRKVIAEASGNLRNHPDAAESYLSIGIAHFKLRQFHDSLGPFRKYLLHFPNDPQALTIVTLIESAERGDLNAREELESIHRSGRNITD